MPGERDALRDWHRLFGLLLTDFFTGLPFIVEVERDLSEQQQFLDVPDAVGATWSSSASRTLGFRRDATRVIRGFWRRAPAMAPRRRGLRETMPNSSDSAPVVQS